MKKLKKVRNNKKNNFKHKYLPQKKRKSFYRPVENICHICGGNERECPLTEPIR